jgi:hypothetical protein
LSFPAKVLAFDVRFGPKADIGCSVKLLHFGVPSRERMRRGAQRTHGIGFAFSNDGTANGCAWQWAAGLDLNIAAKLLAELQQLSRLSAWHRLY